MGDIAFNISKASVGYYAGLPGSTDSLIIVPLESSGLDDDSTLADYDTLAALLANNTEQTTMGRKTLSSVALTVDDTNNVNDVTADDVTWAAATGNAVGAVVICYKPTSSSADTDVIPLSKHDFSAVPAGLDLTAGVGTAIRVS